MLKIIAKISMGLFLAATPFLIYGFGGETLRVLAAVSVKDSRIGVQCNSFVVRNYCTGLKRLVKIYYGHITNRR